MATCPRCHGPLGFDAAVCPACRFAPALGSEVGLVPPRAARSDPDFEMPPLRRAKIRRMWRWWQLAGLALVPGLGHWLDLQPRMAALFTGGVLGGIMLALIQPFEILAILLVVLAAGLHAWSILDHTPWRHADLLPRFLVLIVLNLVCGFLWSLAIGFGSPFSLGTATEERGLFKRGWQMDGLSTVVAVLLTIGFGFLIARWFMRRRG